MNDYLNRVGRPAQTVNRGPADIQGPASAPAPAPAGGKKSKSKFNFGKVLFVAFSVLIAIVLVSAIVLLATGQKGATGAQIQGDKYQAIFLNSADGQVYFGKLSVMNHDYYKLTDIYYVRVQQVQPDKNQTAQQNISLAKLGNEIHGPQDVMYINKDHVLFWENLKEDGQVVKAIREYQKNPTPAANTNTSGTGTPTTDTTKKTN
jgi:hypothetical protein